MVDLDIAGIDWWNFFKLRHGFFPGDLHEVSTRSNSPRTRHTSRTGIFLLESNWKVSGGGREGDPSKSASSVRLEM